MRKRKRLIIELKLYLKIIYILTRNKKNDKNSKKFKYQKKKKTKI